MITTLRLERRPNQNAAPKETSITPPATGKNHQSIAIALLTTTTFSSSLDLLDSFLGSPRKYSLQQ